MEVRRLDRHRAAIGGGRVVASAHRRQGKAEVETGLRVGGSCLDDTAIAGHRLLVLAEREIHAGEIRLDLVIVGVLGERGLKQRDRAPGIAALHGENPEHVVGRRVIGMALEQPTVALLGKTELPGLVIAPRACEGQIDVRHALATLHPPRRRD